MRVQLEDNVGDVLGKAMRGLGFGLEDIQRKTGLEKKELEALLAGEGGGEEAFVKVARQLKLDGKSLFGLQRIWDENGGFLEEEPTVDGLWQLRRDVGSMWVSAYLVADRERGEAALFDTGVEVDELNRILDEEGLVLKQVFYTHSHWDHVIEKEFFPVVPHYSHEEEWIEGTERFSMGQVFKIGHLCVETRLTSGHSPAGVTYLIKGLEAAIVGDALFARSMGGGKWNYEEALRTNKKEIFQLPKETILCPGHGPMTRVMDEMEENPFWVGS